MHAVCPDADDGHRVFSAAGQTGARPADGRPGAPVEVADHRRRHIRRRLDGQRIAGKAIESGQTHAVVDLAALRDGRGKNIELGERGDDLQTQEHIAPIHRRKAHLLDCRPLQPATKTQRRSNQRLATGIQVIIDLPQRIAGRLCRRNHGFVQHERLDQVQATHQLRHFMIDHAHGKQ